MSEFSRLVDSVSPSGIRRFFDLVANTTGVISLGVGEPDFITPWTIREDVIFTLEKGFTTYTSNAGLLSCRKAVVDYLLDRFDCSYDAESEILLTVGVSEAVDLCFRVLLNPGDEVIIPDPNYVCYEPLAQLAGGTVVSLDTSDTAFIPDVMRLKRLISSKTKVLVLCSPNNPTGRVIPRDVLVEIGELAKIHDFWILADEIYAELVYDDSFVSFASLTGLKERTVLLNGFSKAFAMTGWRLGYMCGPTHFISRALKIHQYSIMCAPIMSQYAGMEALKHARVAIWDMKASYLARRDFVVSSLIDMGLEVCVPEGAFYCFPSIRSTGLSSEDFCMKLLETEQVAVVPGTAFGVSGEGFIRCCYATSMDDLKIAMARMRRFVNE